MHKKISLKICASFLFLLLTHCGGGTVESEPNNSPSLGLGSLLTTNEEAIVVAADSTTIELDLQDLEQESLSFLWQLARGEQQLKITDYLQAPLDESLSNSPTAIFQAPVQADEKTFYTITVTVTDNNGKSETKQIKITVLPTPQPKAFIEHDEKPSTGYLRLTPFNLNASSSTAGEGATLSGYQWQLFPPTGSSTTVLDADQVQARFIPDIPGSYSITLTVTNSANQQNSNTLMVTATNRAPTVSLVPAQTASLYSGDTLTIKSTAEDPENDDISHHWQVTHKGNDATAAVLGSEKSALLQQDTVTFTAPTAQNSAGDYMLNLLLRDSYGAENVTAVLLTITVLQASLPIAMIGYDEAPDTGYLRMDTINLDASDSSAGAGATLSGYQWQLSPPTGSNTTVLDADQVQARFIPDIPGDYTVTLTVSNSNAKENSRNLVFSVINQTPTVSLIPAQLQYLHSGESIVLEASAEDGDGDTLQYHWLVTLAGDTVDVTAEVLGQDTDALLAMNEVTFTAPDTAQTRDYLVQLTVKDSHGAKKIINAPNIRVSPNAVPIAKIQPSPATNAQGYARHTAITLDGSSSTASEDRASITSYQWSLTAVPQGSAAKIFDATQSLAYFTPDRPGTYTITLDVSDTLQRSHSGSVTLIAFN